MPFVLGCALPSAAGPATRWSPVALQWRRLPAAAAPSAARGNRAPRPGAPGGRSLPPVSDTGLMNPTRGLTRSRRRDPATRCSPGRDKPPPSATAPFRSRTSPPPPSPLRTGPSQRPGPQLRAAAGGGGRSPRSHRGDRSRPVGRAHAAGARRRLPRPAASRQGAPRARLHVRAGRGHAGAVTRRLACAGPERDRSGAAACGCGSGGCAGSRGCGVFVAAPLAAPARPVPPAAPGQGGVPGCPLVPGSRGSAGAAGPAAPGGRFCPSFKGKRAFSAGAAASASAAGRFERVLLVYGGLWLGPAPAPAWTNARVPPRSWRRRRAARRGIKG